MTTPVRPISICVFVLALLLAGHLVACSGGKEAGRTYDTKNSISFKTPAGWDASVQPLADGATTTVVELTKGGMHISVYSDANQTMNVTPDKRPGYKLVKTDTLRVVGVDSQTWLVESGSAEGGEDDGESEGDGDSAADNQPATGAGAAPRVVYTILVKTEKREVAIEASAPKGSEDEITAAAHAIAGSLRIE